MEPIMMYVVTHKQASIPDESCYIPIVVGSSKDIHYVKIIRDNTGKNISEKNPNYCELTALYWIWKNQSPSIAGFCHYRRYFTTGILAEFKNRVISKEKIEEFLIKYDIILPVPWVFKNDTISEQIIGSSVREDDLQKLRALIQEKYPNYLKSYDDVMNGYSISCYNMMICRKEQLDAYCSWLFDILFDFEKQVDLNDRSDYEKRIFGFLSERLLNVWVKQNDLRVKYLHVLETENKKNAFTILKNRIKGLKWTLS